MSTWRKMGSAYMLTDDYSTLWIKKISSRWHLLERTTQGWNTLAIHNTLAEAQADGSTLMED